MITDNSIKAKPLQLLTPYRFDIMAKYIYAEERVKGIKSKWAEKIYREHINVFNGFFENIPRKTCYEDFKKSFDSLIDELSNNDFDSEKSLIPIAYNGSPLNGAHRIAASLANDKDVQCYFTDDPSAGQLDCSYYYFATKRDIVPAGLDMQMSDHMALKYAKLKPSCHLLFLFSHTVINESEIDKVIMNYGLPVYEKRLNLSEHGRVNLMRQLYLGEDWVGDRSNYFYGARVKAGRCFAKGSNLRVMLFDAKTDADLVLMKERIRQLFDVGKDSVHINDTHEETVRLSEIIFNNNSLIASNNFHAVDRTGLKDAVRRFKRVCRKSGIDPETLCLAGPASLASYGVHDTEEIQVISKFESPQGYQCLNDLVDQSELDRTELIYNPANYLYFEGMKILTLQNVEVFNKAKREIERLKYLTDEITDDFSATAYAENNKDCGVVLIWPQALNLGLDSQVIEELSGIATILYRKDINMSLEAGRNLLMQIHEGKPWWEQEIDNEVPKRFTTQTLHFVLFKYDDINKLRKWKKDFREELGLGKVIFHLSDPDCEKHIGVQCACKPDQDTFHRESLKHVHLLLNKNSLKFLEEARPCKLELFDKHMALFKDWVKGNNINPQDCCIDNGTVLAAYGLRDSHDLDFLYSGQFVNTGIPGVDCHNFFYQEIREQLDLEIDKDQIINDPNNHFYYKGFKFCSIDILELIKRDRLVNGQRREKDIRDFNLIQALKSKSQSKAS